MGFSKVLIESILKIKAYVQDHNFRYKFVSRLRPWLKQMDQRNKRSLLLKKQQALYPNKLATTPVIFLVNLSFHF